MESFYVSWKLPLLFACTTTTTLFLFSSLNEITTSLHSTTNNNDNNIALNWKELHKDCPCDLYPDATYGGLMLNCSSKNLPLFQPHWIPSSHCNVTILTLNNNQLRNLSQDSFVKAPELLYLDLSQNRFTSLQPGWFRGIKMLQVLKLDQNFINLDKASFKENAFRFLTFLNVLDLGSNNNLYVEGSYPEFLLQDLPHLEVLILDTFATDLDFGPIFDNVTTITDLTLTGGVRHIRNESFLPCGQTPLKTLRFEKLPLLMHTDSNAFTPLKSLDNIYMKRVKQGIGTTLLSLKPFVGRNFSNLYFDDIGSSALEISTFEGNKVITNAMGKYLKEICVENISLMSSYVLYVSIDAIDSKTLNRCLKHINFMNNPLHGAVIAFLTFQHFSQLISIVLSLNRVNPVTITTCRKIGSIYGKKPGFTKEKRLSLYHVTKRGDDISTISRYTRIPGNSAKRTHNSETNLTKSDHCVSNCSLFAILMSEKYNIGENDISAVRCYNLPAMLEYIFISDIAHRFLSMNYFIIFCRNSLKELYMSDNGIHSISGQMIGLDHLQLLDISRNDGKEIRKHFFDHFPSLKTLLMQEMNLDISFIATSSSLLFYNLRNLEAINLSSNELYLLSEDTFRTTKLKVLILAKNRFKSIPVSLTSLPHLCLLDLSYNSISVFSQDEMNQLDQKVKNKNVSLSLNLEGNILSCSCNHYRFLLWLHKTTVNLDLNGNYSCINGNGELSYTFAFNDTEAFWRECHGKTALFVSIILFSTMCLAFTLATSLFHFQTRLEAYVHQVILRKVTPKTPSDFPIGVCIEYSDQDATFACLPLRTFIETELGFTTFIRHRDLLANQYRDVAISDNINCSWRVLLVVTESYLTSDHWSFFTMKLASSSVTATNQGKIVLLVETGLEKRVPMCVLQAAQENSIISIQTRPCQVTRDVKKLLTTALGRDPQQL